MQQKSRGLIIVGVLALLWNLLGLAGVAGDAMMDEQAVSQLTEAQRSLRDGMPIWAKAGSFVAVIAGTIGSIGLIMRRQWAVGAFMLSIIGLIAQDIWMYGMADVKSAYGVVPLVLQGVVFAIAIGLWLYARSAASTGRLR